MKRTTTVLKDHVKIGSRFVPKWLVDDKFTEISYTNVILPEILWIGLINDRIGHRKGILLLESFVQTTLKNQTNKMHNYAICSNYNMLDNEEKEKITHDIKRNGILGELQKCLAPLTCLFQDFPISFIEPPSEIIGEIELLTTLKKCLTTHLDKLNINTVISHANIIYINIRSGRLKFCNGTHPPNLNILLDNPESEEALKVGSSVRASVMAEFSFYNERHTFEWPMSFWKQCYGLEKCNFDETQHAT